MSRRTRKRFSWSDPAYREEVSLRLMDEGRELALEWLIAETPEDKRSVEAYPLDPRP